MKIRLDRWCSPFHDFSHLHVFCVFVSTPPHFFLLQSVCFIPQSIVTTAEAPARQKNHPRWYSLGATANPHHMLRHIFMLRYILIAYYGTGGNREELFSYTRHWPLTSAASPPVTPRGVTMGRVQQLVRTTRGEKGGGGGWGKYLKRHTGQRSKPSANSTGLRAVVHVLQ